MKTFFKGFLFLFFLAIFTTSCSDQNDDVNTPPDQTTAQRLKLAASAVARTTTDFPGDGEEDYADDCIEDFDCFEFVFPITVTNDGTTTTLADEDAFFEYLDDLPEDADPEIVFPIDIVFEDGETATIDSEEALEEAYDECFGDDECFELQFPLTVTDGTTDTVVNDEEELHLFYDGLDEDADVDFVYPITLIFTDDGTEVVVADDEEFDEIYSDCYDYDDYDDYDDFECFEVQFPVTAQDASGSDITINSYDDLEAYFDSLPEDAEPSFTFPITLVYEEGETETIDSLEELEGAFDDCFYDDEDDYDDDDEFAGEICFDIVYPITLVAEDGSVLTIESDETFGVFLDSLAEEEYFEFTYPMNIVFEDGTTQTINSDDEFIAAVESCFLD